MQMKQLINLTEDHKSWIKRVVELSRKENSGLDTPTSQTEIIRILVGQAMVEDPESFLHRIGKMRLKAKLDDIERKRTQLDDEEKRLAAELGVQPPTKVTR